VKQVDRAAMLAPLLGLPLATGTMGVIMEVE